MLPEWNKIDFTTLDNTANSLVETLYSTISQISQAAEKKETLVPYITSLLHQHAFTLQQVDDKQRLICGTHNTNPDNTTNTAQETLLLFSSYSAQHSARARARWGSFVLRLLAFALYHSAIGTIPLNIVWFIELEAAPENNETVMQWIGQHQNVFRVGGCLYDLPFDASLPPSCLTLGMKGLLSIELGVKTSSHDQHVSYGSILPDAAWRLIWALYSLKDAREEIQIEGFYETLVPMDDEEIALLDNMLPDEQRLKQRLNVNQFLLQLHGLQLYYAYLLLPTCTVTSITSGDPSASTQTLPSSAKALLEIQIVPDQEPEDIYEKLRKHLDVQGFQDVYIKVLAQRSPQHTALQNKFAKIVYESASVLYRKDLRVLPLMPSSKIHYAFPSQLTIPTVYSHLFDRENQLYEHDTVVDDALLRRFLTNGMKHIAMIIEGMRQ